jgi:hypothetical protein
LNTHGPEVPRDLTQPDQQRLRIVAYWPKTRKDDHHVGYGMARSYLWLQLGVIGNMVLQRAFQLFAEPRLRPRAHFLVRNAPMIVAAISLAIVTNRMQRTSGYYHIDSAGRPTRFLSKQMPPSIHGRLGTSRGVFLRRIH